MKQKQDLTRLRAKYNHFRYTECEGDKTKNYTKYFRLFGWSEERQRFEMVSQYHSILSWWLELDATPWLDKLDGERPHKELE